jgi:drug/metabolite transporter (DMT)-like permease
MTRVQANLLLLLAAAIWGGGFVAQSTAMKAIGPFWFIGLRFAVATVAVLPFL